MPVLWDPSGISVGTIALCSLYTARFTHRPVLTSTSFQTIHSFSVLPSPLILVLLSNRQRHVSNMSRHGWILTNLNSTMTKLRHWLLVLALGQVSATCSEHLEIGGSPIPFQPKVKSLWVVLDSSLTMSHHISSVCHSAYLELCRISPIHPFLTTSATAALVCSRVLSQIDYCNSLLAGITSDQIDLLQRTLNNSAQLIFRKKRTEHVTPMLISLHWLPIKLHWIQTSDTGFPLLWWYIYSTIKVAESQCH